MPQITHAGATIAYSDTGVPAGRPEAPTIVFGHGLLFSGWMFSAQIAALQDRYRCVAIDWRGQGATPPSPGGYDMDTLTGDAAALISHLDVGPVHWVGLSMGGFVGLRLAARQPSLIRSLSLLNTSADRESKRAFVEDLALAGLYRAFGIGPVRGSVSKVMFGPTFLGQPSTPAVIDEWITMLSKSDRAAIASAVIGVIRRAGVREELARIEAPTLVITGEHDKPTPAFRGQAIAAGITGARLEQIPGCGHSSTIEAPEVVSALLTELLDAH